MCRKKQFKYCPSEIDECMKPFIYSMKAICSTSRVRVVACCCGHNKYPMTVIVKNKEDSCWDLISGKTIPRKRNFYKKDEEGYYYIPETIKQDSPKN